MKNAAGPFFWSAFAMVAGFLGTALISPLYPLYQRAWGLQVSQVSFLYVIYMLGALGSFVFLGRLSDKVGFRRLLIVALGFSFFGTAISAFASNHFWLSSARFLVGVASSIVTSAGSVALANAIAPARKHQLALIMGLLLSFGFGLGPLIGGIFGQWAPNPLVTAYLPAALMLIVALAGMGLKVPPPAASAQARRLTLADFLPKLTAPERGHRLLFAIACGFPFLAFGMFGIYASLSPLFIEKTLGWTGPIASGASIAFILFASAIFQIAIRRVEVGTIAAYGLLALALSGLALMINLSAGSAGLFVLSLALTAVGHSMTMLAGMTLLQMISTPQNRGGLTSTYLVVGYAGGIVPLLGVGWIADRWGLTRGVTSFCVVTVLLAAALAAAFEYAAQKRRQASVQAA